MSDPRSTNHVSLLSPTPSFSNSLPKNQATRTSTITHPPKQSKIVSAKETVQAQIAASPVVVYSKSYCPYCAKTKTLLTELGAKFEVVELDEVAGGSEQQDALEELTGQSTVPNVFVGGKSIGGNLEPLLKQSGAL